jgi:hypothetical protein
MPPTNNGGNLLCLNSGEFLVTWTGAQSKEPHKSHQKGEAGDTTLMSALLKNRIIVLKGLVLTPRGNDINPGIWTRGHRPPQKSIPLL